MQVVVKHVITLTHLFTIIEVEERAVKDNFAFVNLFCWILLLLFFGDGLSHKNYADKKNK